MATYEGVFQAYYDFANEQNNRQVLHTNKTQGQFGMTETEVGETLQEITDRIMSEPSQQEVTQVLQQSVEQSRLGVDGLKRFALSQINPFYIQRRSRLTITNHAEHLRTGRVLCEALLQQPLALAEPINDTFVPGRPIADLSSVLHYTANVVYSLSKSSEDGAQVEAEKALASHDLTETFLAGVAMSELEPARVVSQMQHSQVNRFVRECDILMSARNISRSMHRFTQPTPDN